VVTGLVILVAKKSIPHALSNFRAAAYPEIPSRPNDSGVFLHPAGGRSFIWSQNPRTSRYIIAISVLTLPVDLYGLQTKGSLIRSTRYSLADGRPGLLHLQTLSLFRTSSYQRVIGSSGGHSPKCCAESALKCSHRF
jgi:hypothetical protein